MADVAHTSHAGESEPERLNREREKPRLARRIATPSADERLMRAGFRRATRKDTT